MRCGSCGALPASRLLPSYAGPRCGQWRPIGVDKRSDDTGPVCRGGGLHFRTPRRFH